MTVQYRHKMASSSIEVIDALPRVSSHGYAPAPVVVSASGLRCDLSSRDDADHVEDTHVDARTRVRV